jgi:hypothetical protein
MRLIRFVLFHLERIGPIGDWLAVRRYRKLASEFDGDQPRRTRPLTPEFQKQRRELRKRRLSLELGRELDRIAAGADGEA